MSGKIFLKPPMDFVPIHSVVGIYIRAGEEILFLKRAPHKPHGNTWNIPGGKVETGETLLEAIIRETREESGIILDAPLIKHVVEVYAKGLQGYFVYNIFQYNTQKTPVILNEEHQAFLWLTLEEAKKLPLIEGERACIDLIHAL